MHLCVTFLLSLSLSLSLSDFFFKQKVARLKALGFTILEILVVISVVAVLIGISIPRIKGMQEAAKVSKAARELKALQAAVESYRTFHSNILPSDITTTLTSANPQMISATLVDPFNNSDYQYIQRGSFYAIATVGPNGVSDSFTMTSEGTVTVSGDDTAVTNGSFGSTSGGSGDTPADPCEADDAASGTVCSDGTVYVNSTLRTTISDVGYVAWIDCAACGGENNGGCADVDMNWACSGGEPNPAAQACASLSTGDHSDWRVPTLGELNELFLQGNCKSENGNCDDTGAVVGGFGAGGYWSSEELDSFTARGQDFYDGTQTDYTKDSGLGVRCVRSP